MQMRQAIRLSARGPRRCRDKTGWIASRTTAPLNPERRPPIVALTMGAQFPSWLRHPPQTLPPRFLPPPRLPPRPINVTVVESRLLYYYNSSRSQLYIFRIKKIFLYQLKSDFLVWSRFVVLGRLPPGASALLQYIRAVVTPIRHCRLHEIPNRQWVVVRIYGNNVACWIFNNLFIKSRKYQIY